MELLLNNPPKQQCLNNLQISEEGDTLHALSWLKCFVNIQPKNISAKTLVNRIFIELILEVFITMYVFK